MQDISEEIVGLSPTEASKLLREHGLLFQIVMKDGISLPSRQDKANMIKVKVRNNEVVEVL